MVVIPSPSHFGGVHSNKLLNASQLVQRKPRYAGQTYRIKPELRFQGIPLDMNVRRLFAFIGIIEEPVRSAPQDGGHP
jgi:hypothetical protein